MRPLHQKLWRDLWRQRSQAIAVAAVIAAGIATSVLSQTNLASLRAAQRSFYRDLGFADVFCSLKRAPSNLAAEIAALPGVTRVETRVVGTATLEVPGFADPVTAQLVSVPARGRPHLNDVFLRRGRYLDPTHAHEVLLSEAFADAHDLQPGDQVTAIIQGRRQRLQVAGVALSPEFVYALPPGSVFPDDQRFAVCWMARPEVEAAFDLGGAFNDVSLQLASDHDTPAVIAAVDRQLTRYGGLGAVARRNQPSHWYLEGELRQLSRMGWFTPLIFGAVAAFLVHIVLARLVAAQRPQIAVLKAFGYTNAQVAIHYVQLVLLITAGGVVAGIAGGAWFGHQMTSMYTEFFHFPALVYVLPGTVVAGATAIAAVVAASGAVEAARRAALLPPAEAMRPAAPGRYRPSLLERIGLGGLLSTPARIALRHIERRPVRSILTVLGIALAAAVIVVGQFTVDAFEHVISIHFGAARRETAAVTFVKPRPHRALHEIERLPGVIRVEPFRTVAARLRHGARSRRVAIEALADTAHLHRTVGADGRPAPSPPSGLLLSDKLGEVLGAAPGDRVLVEVLEGRRPRVYVQVEGLVVEHIGLGAYARLDAVGRLLGEAGVISGCYVTIDPRRRDEVFHTLKERPRVASVAETTAALESFQETLAETMAIFTGFLVLLASVIAFGVVYNSVHIALAESARELASLRVLGFTRGEVAAILLGEAGVLVVAALPAGAALGWALAWLVGQSLDTEVYRIPVVVAPRTYAFASAVTLAAAVVSGLWAFWKIRRLDLIEVLKTRE